MKDRLSEIIAEAIEQWGRAQIEAAITGWWRILDHLRLDQDDYVERIAWKQRATFGAVRRRGSTRGMWS